MKKKTVKNCSLGASCKQTCIARSKDCLPLVSPKNRLRIQSAVARLKKSKAIDRAEKEFISKGGSIPAAGKLLTALLSRERISYSGSAPEGMKDMVSDFYTLTGKTQKLAEVSLGAGRSQADRRNRSIKINSEANALRQRKELFHELGHFAGQSNKASIQAEKDFLNSRIKPGSKLELLNDIMGTNKFGMERAYRGRFPNPYTGKYYISGATEVFSTGFENFASASDLSKFYKSDPEHFSLIMSYIRG
jgi:hypothetical protein